MTHFAMPPHKEYDLIVIGAGKSLLFRLAFDWRKFLVGIIIIIISSPSSPFISVLTPT